MEPPAGARPDDAQGRAWSRSSARCRDADPAHYVRGQYDGYRDDRRASPPDSTTETYAALRLEIDNWRWAGVPFFIRTGKRLPVTQTEVRLVFKQPPRLGLRVPTAAPPEPEPARDQARPDAPGSGCSLDAQRARRAPSPSRSRSTWSSPSEGGEGADARTRCCCTPRWSATARASPARTASRRPGGSCSRCSTRRRRCTPTRQGSWGPAAADALVAGLRRLARPVGGVMSAAERAAPPSAARAVAVPADRRLRVPLGLPHRRAGRARRRDRLALRAALRLAERVRHACSTARPGCFRFGPFGINVPDRARLRARARTSLVDHLEHADRLGRGARRADDGPAHAARTTVTPHTRPPADDDADHLLVRTVECLEGSVEIELVCEPVFDYGRDAGRVDARRRRPARRRRDRRGPDDPAADRPARSASRATACARRHVLERGRAGCTARCRGPRAWPRRPTSTRPTRGSPRRRAFWRALARPARGSPTTAGASRSSARR